MQKPFMPLLFLYCIFSATFLVQAQLIGVQTVENISFGTLAQQGNGGSVTMDPSGTIGTTGSVLHLGGSRSYPALFDVEATEGTIVSYVSGTETTITGSNGGSITFRLGSSSPTVPFVVNTVPPAKTRVAVGGTLVIGDQVASPPGSYSGTFLITFNNE
jgi:hypothetical protein